MRPAHGGQEQHERYQQQHTADGHGDHGTGQGGDVEDDAIEVHEAAVAEGGVLDRLLAEEGLVEKLVEEDGIIDRLAASLDQLAKLGPVLESLDRPIRAVDESAQVISLAGDAVKDIAVRLPGFVRRTVSETQRTVAETQRAAARPVEVEIVVDEVVTDET